MPGNSVTRRLVQADREHPRIVVEDGLHAVAVVHVDVDVRDPLRTQVEQPRDRDRRVVVDAEAGRARRHRVVQAAGDVDRARARAPVQTASAAAIVAPAISALASCMPGKTGLSAVPRP